MLGSAKQFDTFACGEFALLVLLFDLIGATTEPQSGFQFARVRREPHASRELTRLDFRE